MNSFAELVATRRSMRKFTPEPLTETEIHALMKSALMAPTSKRSNSWQFFVVTDKGLLEQLSQCKPQAAAFIADAPLAVVVTANPAVSDVWVEDASIASIYLQLQAEDMGLGSCWVQVRERMYDEQTTADAYIHQLLDIDPALRVLSVVAIGHKGMERKPFNEEHLLWGQVHHD